MTYEVTAPAFNGPLGLLLDLAEKGKVELTDISIAAITAEYLTRVKGMGQLEPEELSGFLQLGSRLLYIKSLALLPAASQPDAADELSRLNLELEEYQRYRMAARQLGRQMEQSSWHRTPSVKLAPHELPLPELSLQALGEAFNRAIKRAEPAMPHRSVMPAISQQQIEHRLTKQLNQGGFELTTLLDSATDRYEVIVMFLALLELIKNNIARVTQAAQFEAIMVEAVGE